jgi:hypothetical protein
VTTSPAFALANDADRDGNVAAASVWSAPHVTGVFGRCTFGGFRKADSGGAYRAAPTIDTLRPVGSTAVKSSPRTFAGDQSTAVHDVDVMDLRRRLAATPGDAPLRLRFARYLLDTGDTTGAAVHVSLVLQQHADHPEAVALLQVIMTATMTTVRAPASSHVSAF